MSGTATKPIRVQRKRTKGYRLPPNTVCVTRPGPFGNPFKVGENWNPFLLTPNSPAQAVAAFRAWLEDVEEGQAVAKRARTDLRGKNLACYCKPGSPCHAEVLLELANAPEVPS